MKKIKAWILLRIANFGLFIFDCKPDDENFKESDFLDIRKLNEMKRSAEQELESK